MDFMPDEIYHMQQVIPTHVRVFLQNLRHFRAQLIPAIFPFHIVEMKIPHPRFIPPTIMLSHTQSSSNTVNL